MSDDLVIGNGLLHVVLRPLRGADVVSVRDMPSGSELLAVTPWQPLDSTAGPILSPSQWLTGYPGGWQLLTPNAGAPCEYAGVAHGFHGEASRLPWTLAAADATALTLTCGLPMGLRAVRTARVSGRTLEVTDEVLNDADEDVPVLWVEHIGLGGDLLDASAELELPAGRLVADDAYDPPGNQLRPGRSSMSPFALGRDGRPCDLRRPLFGGSCFAYLVDVGEPRLTVRAPSRGIAAILRWDSAVLPYLWLWQELGGTAGAPWYGRGRILGLEPAASWPQRDLAAHAADGTAPAVPAGGSLRATVSLTVTSLGDSISPSAQAIGPA